MTDTHTQIRNKLTKGIELSSNIEAIKRVIDNPNILALPAYPLQQELFKEVRTHMNAVLDTLNTLVKENEFDIAALEYSKWYSYEIPPIDFRWEHLNSPEHILATIKNDDDWEISAHIFEAAYENAKKLASSLGWEGDALEEAVFFVPVEGEFRYGFALKQSNNGTTYIISPIPLPHLENQ